MPKFSLGRSDQTSLVDMAEELTDPFKELASSLPKLPPDPSDLLSPTSDFLDALSSGEYLGPTNHSLINSPFPSPVERIEQRAPEWIEEPYSTSTIGKSGCGPTSVAMVARSLGVDVSPKDMAEFSAANEFYKPGVGTYFTLYPAAAEHLGLQSETLGTDIDAIKAELDKGNPIILSIKSGALGYGGHLMVIDGYNTETGQFSIKDPGYNDVQSLTDAKLKEVIYGSWSFSR